MLMELANIINLDDDCDQEDPELQQLQKKVEFITMADRLFSQHQKAIKKDKQQRLMSKVLEQRSFSKLSNHHAKVQYDLAMER
jgi:hypothetical protein